MANIWMLSPYAMPSNYGWHSRTFIMSKDLVNRGHNVTVFSFKGSHYLHLKDPKTITSVIEKHEGVVFNWFKSILFKKDNFVIRIINWEYYNLQLKNFFKNYEGNAPDSIVFSIPSISHTQLIPLAKSLFPKAKIIFEIQDIWPLSIQYLGGYSDRNILIRKFKKAENIAFNKADEIIAVQPGIFKYIEDYFKEIDEVKVHFIPHAFLPTNISEKPIEYDIGYAGTISRANDLDTLIKALVIVKKIYNCEPKVLIIGAGVKEVEVKKSAFHLKNIKFISWINRVEVLVELSKCKICYDGFLNLGLYDYGFSRLKWVDYMLLKKPILAAYSGANIDVEIEKIGWQTEAQNAKMLADKIYEILNLPKSIIKDKGESGYKFLLEQRNIDLLGREYEKLLINYDK